MTFHPYMPLPDVDGSLMTAPFRSSFEGSAGKKAGACLVGIIDFPISIAIDTLLLPYDVIRSASNDEMGAQQ